MASLLLVCALTCQSPTHGASPYLFFDFADTKAFPTGGLTGTRQGLQTITPVVEIVEETTPEAGRHLNVSGAAVIVSNRFTGDDLTHLEVWVKPHAVHLANGAEFLDYDGAVLGFFLNEDGEAELHALHLTDNDKGFWISTGLRLPVTDGRARSWHRVNITQHWKLGVWDLAVDGVNLLQGLGRGSSVSGLQFELWLYGHGQDAANSFDDLLVSAEPPDVLEAVLARERQQRAMSSAHQTTGGKTVSASAKDAERRLRREPKADRNKSARTEITDIHVKVVGGGRHIGEFESTDKKQETKKFALYTPGYDENGKPKPLDLEIRCDMQLAPGVSLDEIQWAITEDPKGDAKSVRVILWGTFANGPRLTAKVPSEWSNKPLSIQCGHLGIVEKSR